MRLRTLLSDTDWLRLAMVKDLQPGEMTADAEDDTYLDDEDADWKTTTQGQKSVGDTSATLAWRPGDSGQKKLVQLFDSGEICAFRIKYPNGTVDVFRGWLSSLGKTIASKDVMTRTVKISGVGRPYLAEEGTETVGVTGLTVAPASASINVGATTTLTFTVKPDGASDKAISVHSTDPQTATVTLNGLVATVKGVKQGSVSIVGMTSDGDFVAVATVAVSAQVTDDTSSICPVIGLFAVRYDVLNRHVSMKTVRGASVSCPGCRELNIWRLFSSERQSLMPGGELSRLNDRLLFCGWGWISMPGWFPAHCGMRISLRM